MSKLEVIQEARDLLLSCYDGVLSTLSVAMPQGLLNVAALPTPFAWPLAIPPALPPPPPVP